MAELSSVRPAFSLLGHQFIHDENEPGEGARGCREHPAAFILVEIMIVVAIIGLLAAITIPNFARARARAQATATLEAVRQIDHAKHQYPIENNQPGPATPRVADIHPA